MRRWLIIGAMSAIGLFPLSTFAEKGHDHEGHDAAKSKGSVVGEVVDVTCYLAHPDSGIGPEHAKCAASCINKGLPVAIKQGDTLYIATGANHNSANKMLSKYAAKQVRAKGEVKTLNGLNMIFVEEVEVVE